MTNFATIAFRELRTHARQGASYRQRAASGLVAGAIVTVMLIIGTLFSAMRTMGPAMFHTLAWLGFVFCLVEGLRGTVDCLSSERREGTLGLLFLTELAGFDVIAGKFIVHSTASFYRLFAALPALAIPFVIGGVTGGEFWRMMLALLNTLFFSLAAGMLVSACGRSEQRVWGAGLVVVGLFAVGFPLLDQALSGSLAQNAVALFGLFSPRQAFHAAAAASYQVDPLRYWKGLGICHLTAWSFLFAAGWRLARNWNQSPDHSRARWWETLFQKSRPPQAGISTIADPLIWLARLDGSRFRWAYMGLAGIAGIGLLLWFASLATTPDEWWAVAIVFWVAHWGLRIWAAVQACTAMATLKESGMMELLLAAPITDLRLIGSLNAGLRRAYLPPMALLAALELGAILLFAVQVKELSALIMGLLGCALCVGILYEDLCAVSFAGLWYTLTLPKTTTAITRTITRVLLLPLGAIVLLPFGLLFCGMGIPVFFLIKGITIGNTMRDRLERQFRQRAAQPLTAPAPTPGWWPFGRSKSPPPPLLTAPPPRASAIVHCSICGQAVSAQAQQCPFCKWPLNQR